MPSGRKSALKKHQKGGGFGKSLQKRSTDVNGGIAFLKPDISRLLTQGESEKKLTILDFIDRDAGVSALEMNDLEDYIATTLQQHNANAAPLVICNRDGSLLDTATATVVKVRTEGLQASQTSHNRQFDLPIRPFRFLDPLNRVLTFAQYFGKFLTEFERQPTEPMLYNDHDPNAASSDEDDNHGDDNHDDDNHGDDNHGDDSNDDGSKDDFKRASSEDGSEDGILLPPIDLFQEPVCLRSNNKDEKENELGHEEIIAALQKCEDIRVIYSAFYHYFAKVVNFGPLLCASDLQREELRSFTEWRRGLSECELEEKVVIAPYEKNLEYWKQLWRTIERSDIVLEIVDSRNPLIYRSGALEKLIESYDKKVILCLNKADYLSANQRRIWSRYFEEVLDIDHIHYCSLRELEDDDGYDDGDGDGDGDGQRDGSSRDSSRDEEDLSKLNLLDLSREKLRQRDHQGGEQRVVPRSGGSSSKSPESEVVLSLAAAEDWEGVLSMSQLRAHLETLGVQVREKQSAKRLRCLQILGALENKLASSASIHDEFCDYLAENAARHIEELHSGAQTRSKVLPHSVLPHSVLPHSARDKTRTGRDKTRTGRSMVIRLLGSIDAQSPLVVVGTTGFPNVGKSSLINTLMEGTARVGVSRTPGKTRHIQTLQVPNSFLTLCDCPGLVMPTAACSKESLVINGIMNVDTYRGTVVRPVSHVLLRTGEQIAEIYGVTHTFNSLFGTEALHEKALPILNLLASCKGYYTGTKGAVPDVERVGRMLVKQYLEGKLISYCEVAPNADVDAWRHEEQTKWASRKQKWRQHRQKSNQLTVTEKGMKPKKINASGRVIPPRPS